jgi:hypothetical protein
VVCACACAYIYVWVSKGGRCGACARRHSMTHLTVGAEELILRGGGHSPQEVHPGEVAVESRGLARAREPTHARRAGARADDTARQAPRGGKATRSRGCGGITVLGARCAGGCFKPGVGGGLQQGCCSPSACQARPLARPCTRGLHWGALVADVSGQDATPG